MAGGTIVVWGSNSKGQISDIPTGNTFWKIAPGGADQTLAIDIYGKLWLWGKGDAVLQNKLSTDLFSDAALGLRQIIAIRKDNHHFESEGEFIKKRGEYVRADPPPVLKDLPVIAVAAGSDRCIIIDEDGELHEWGVDGVVPTPGGKFTHVSARSHCAVALSRVGKHIGRVYVWGDEGIFDDPSTYFPLSDWSSQTSGGRTFYYHDGDFVDVAAGVKEDHEEPLIQHFLALENGGEVEGWGRNTNNEAKGASPGAHFSAIAAGKRFSIGIAKGGFLRHWGRSDKVKKVKSSDPTGVELSLINVPKGQFVSVGAGADHASAITMELPEAPSVQRPDTIVGRRLS